MESKRGTVQKASHSTTVSGSSAGGNAPVHLATEHVCTFQLGSVIVRIRGSEPAAISDGDEIVVVGSLRRDGLFAARTYVNLTNGVRGGYINALLYRLLGITAIALPLIVGALRLQAPGREWAPLSELLSEGGLVVFGVLGAGLCVFGALLLREASQGDRADQLSRAADQLRQHAMK
jgi:hypothetical protein